MADELKPNPFCGHAVMRDYVANDQWNDITGTEPDTCGMCEEIFRMNNEDWNRRPIEDALRAEVEMRGDQVSALMEQVARYMAEAQDLSAENERLRAESAELERRAERHLLGHHDTVRAWVAEVAALKAMYAEPLTDAQVQAVWNNMAEDGDYDYVPDWDAAIRAAREGE